MGPLRAQDRDRGLHQAGGPGDGHGAIPLGAARLLDRGQRLLPPGCRVSPPAPRALPERDLGPHPIHASWLNQIEVFFSIVQRKLLTPAVADNLEDLEARLLAFGAEYGRQPRPIRWKFTRQDFDRRLRDLEQSSRELAA